MNTTLRYPDRNVLTMYYVRVVVVFSSFPMKEILNE